MIGNDIYSSLASAINPCVGCTSLSCAMCDCYSGCNSERDELRMLRVPASYKSEKPKDKVQSKKGLLYPSAGQCPVFFYFYKQINLKPECTSGRRIQIKHFSLFEKDYRYPRFSAPILQKLLLPVCSGFFCVLRASALSGKDTKMNNNENQYYIYIRGTKERIPVTKQEFDDYYRDINSYRRTEMNNGRCVCPRSKWLSCDMDCLTCPFHRHGNQYSLDATVNRR